MLGGVERIVERPAAVWTRLNGHVQSLRIVGDGRAPRQYPGSTTAPNVESALEDCQLQAPPTAPISAIPVRSPRLARKGCGWPGGLAVSGKVGSGDGFTDRRHTGPDLCRSPKPTDFSGYSPRGASVVRAWHDNHVTGAR
jgi:hypothetical protein